MELIKQTLKKANFECEKTTYFKLKFFVQKALKATQKVIKNLQNGINENQAEHIVHVWKIQEQPDIEKWNEIIDRLQKQPWKYGRVEVPSDGISFAKFDNVMQRIDFHVAIIVKPEIQSLEKLCDIKRDEDLAMSIFAFVPFSVLNTSNKDYKLIIPFGLQKTPAGYGYHTAEDYYKNIKWRSAGGRSRYTTTSRGVRDVLGKLLNAIKKKFPEKIAIVTRFAERESRIEKSLIMQKWSKLFPEKCRIGWGENYKNFIRKEKTADDIDEDTYLFYETVPNLRESYKKPVNPRYDTQDPDTAKALYDYNPGEGGITFNENSQILTMKDRDGKVLFTVEKVSEKKPLAELMTIPVFVFNQGILINVWT